MPFPSLPTPSSEIDINGVKDFLINLTRDLNWLLSELDDLNVNNITAKSIKVSELSAITANLGTITAGTLIGAIIKTAISGARIEISSNQLKTYDSSGVYRGPSWGNLFGPNFGDVGFFDAGVQTLLLKCLGSGNGWQIMPDSGADLNLGETGANIYGYGNWNLPSTTGIGSVSSSEISYLSGVTSSIQSQLDSKANSFSGYSGSVTVQTSSTTTSTLNFSNGILTSVT